MPSGGGSSLRCVPGPTFRSESMGGLYWQEFAHDHETSNSLSQLRHRYCKILKEIWRICTPQVFTFSEAAEGEAEGGQNGAEGSKPIVQEIADEKTVKKTS